MFDFSYFGGHAYTFAAAGLATKSKVFSSRAAANDHMYKLIQKYNLKIKEIWNDHHHKTYCCTNGIKFYIHRCD